MTHRDKERAKSLEYARSQGWIDPVTARLLEQAHNAGVLIRNESEAGADAMRIADLELRLAEYDREILPRVIADADLTALLEKVADLEVALAAERESHAITKRAVTRGTRARCAALEGALGAALQVVRVLCAGPTEMTDEDREMLRAAEALLR